MAVIDSQTYISSLKRLAGKIIVENKSFLITGATGLIGSCIVDLLLYANEYYHLNNKIYALGRSNQRLLNRFSYYTGDNLRFVIQDIIQPLNLDETIDFIIHGASNADPGMYASQPSETIIINISGTTNILNYCKKNLRTRVLLLSTFEVYGKVDDNNNHIENDYGLIDFNMIRSCYPESKRCAEILLRSYVDEYKVNGVIARLSSVYGPTMSQNDNKAHAQFIRSGIAGKNIVLKSKGNQRRTYTYLMDAVSGILHVLFFGESGEAYNISNKRSISTIAGVATMIADICGTQVVYSLPSDFEKKGYSAPQNSILISNKLEDTGWGSEYSLKDGLEETINILKESV